MSWKILFVIAVIFPAVFAFSSNKSTREIFDQWKKRTQEEHPECLKSTGAKIEDVNQFWDDYKMPNDESFKCYLQCVFSSFRLSNADGTINKEEFVQDVDKASNDMVDACNERLKRPSEKCDLLYELVDCLLHYKHIFV
ncbi:hypothetical protein RI129_011032 [Pyrocoelia pectoralis]|uniref:Uncharacterized protein n=1 Tax=Pyrocoelia pectoralis TaxID=417401 RepID=A0AAN7ZH44_9COLE